MHGLKIGVMLILKVIVSTNDLFNFLELYCIVSGQSFSFMLFRRRR